MNTILEHLEDLNKIITTLKIPTDFIEQVEQTKEKVGIKLRFGKYDLLFQIDMSRNKIIIYKLILKYYSKQNNIVLHTVKIWENKSIPTVKELSSIVK